MEVELHRNACKHLSEDDVLHAWGTMSICIRRESDDEPPRWLGIGWLEDGSSVELIAVELMNGWLIIHANAPVQPKFAKEIERARRRAR